MPDSLKGKTTESPPVPRVFHILIGAITGLIGAGLLIFALLLVIASIERSKLPDNPLLITTAVMALIGAFMSLVSYRLLTRKGSRVGGGLLSPTGWRVMGGFFLGGTVVLASKAWQSGDIKVWTAIFFGIAFGRLCFTAAQRQSTKQGSD